MSGNGNGVVEIVTPSGKDDVLKWAGQVTELVNRVAKNKDAEAQKNLEDAVKDLDLKLKAHDEQIKANNRVLGAGDTTGYGNLAKFARRADLPEDLRDVDHTYFNMMVLSPEEAQHVGHLEQRPNLERAVDAFGTSALREMQELNDQLLWYDLFRCGNGHSHYALRSRDPRERLKTHPLWRRWSKLTQEFQRALDETTTGEGKEWVPTILSNRLTELIQPELRVAQLFQHVAMTSQNLDLPVLKADFFASFVAENTADLGSGTTIPSGDSTAGNFSTKVSLVAKKLAEKVLASSEILEDSVVPMASFVPRLMAKSIGRAIEDALNNGDTTVGTGSAQDYDLQSVATTDRRAIWDGLRKKALISGMPNVDISTFTIDNLMTIKGGMGTYGVVPSQGVWIVGFKGLIKLMTVGQASQASAMLTLEKLGPLATVLTGQVGIFMGSPVILSEFVREDVAASGKNTMAGPNTSTTLLYVNRESFVIGDRRVVQVRSSAERLIELDQVIFVGTFRGDFKEYYTTASAANKIVGIGRNFS